MINPFYTIELDINDYNLLALNDFMRLFIIQITSQILYYVTRGNVELFSAIFIEATTYILLGVLAYWLLFNNLVIFKNKKDVKDESYYQHVYSKTI